jgi:hypothetical protein
MELIDKYRADWDVFRKYVEKKAKGRCVINNKNWLKLKDYHFEKFVKDLPHPFGFLFKVIYMTNISNEVPCAYRIYKKHRRQRQKIIASKFETKTNAEIFRKYR